jgi:hypothetical protein
LKGGERKLDISGWDVEDARGGEGSKSVLDVVASSEWEVELAVETRSPDPEAAASPGVRANVEGPEIGPRFKPEGQHAALKIIRELADARIVVV